eukprot:TRINITY_DN3236_c1_g2_i6.p1 TRINITY_DN3236_c1_g2~~TRINITY_DN3236_c1_g2_i6.p1  ORF type:complete len:229 (+),score=33.20 TRINITY_DN3236_c1_g2_i6:91-777(+)
MLLKYEQENTKVTTSTPNQNQVESVTQKNENGFSCGNCASGCQGTKKNQQTSFENNIDNIQNQIQSDLDIDSQFQDRNNCCENNFHGSCIKISANATNQSENGSCGETIKYNQQNSNGSCDVATEKLSDKQISENGNSRNYGLEKISDNQQSSQFQSGKINQVTSSNLTDDGKFFCEGGVCSLKTDKDEFFSVGDQKNENFSIVTQDQTEQVCCSNGVCKLIKNNDGL